MTDEGQRRDQDAAAGGQSGEPSDELAERHQDLDLAGETVAGEVADASPRTSRAFQITHHVGPLPSEEWLEAVEALQPGATREILDDYLEERDHERRMQEQAVELDRTSFRAFDRYQNRQLFAAVAVVLLLAAAGIVLIAVDKPVTGFVLLISELGVLAAAFLGRQLRRDQQGGQDASTEGSEDSEGE